MFAATVVVAAVVAGAIILALGDTSEVSAPAATPTLAVVIAPTAAVTRPPTTRTPSVPQSTPRVVATPAGTPRPTITPLATPTKPLDLATAPALRAADKTVTLQQPPSPFTDHDGKSIVLFDTETKTQKDFGPGTLTSNAFGQDRFAYVDASSEAWLVELPAFTQTSLGKAPGVSFADRYRLLVGNGPNANLYDTRTGTSVPFSSLSQSERTALENSQIEAPFSLPVGLSLGGGTINAAEDPCRDLSGMAQRRCWDARTEDYVIQNASGQVIHSFRALRVASAGPGATLVATAPMCTSAGVQMLCAELFRKWGNRDVPYDDPEFATGTTNLYLVDFAQATTRFVATARYNVLLDDANWPIAADANYVVWTDNYCSPVRGKTRIYDRKAGTITELPGSYWFTCATASSAWENSVLAR